MNRVRRFSVGLTLRITTLAAGVAPAAGPASDGKDIARLVEGKTLDAQLVTANACGNDTLDGAWGVREANEGIALDGLTHWSSRSPKLRRLNQAELDDQPEPSRPRMLPKLAVEPSCWGSAQGMGPAIRPHPVRLDQL
jgi:hypothetical protein